MTKNSLLIAVVFTALSRSVAVAAIGAVVLCTLLGCAREETLESVVLSCAEVPAAKASQNEQLRQLIAQVEQQRGLPNQLDSPLGPDDDNAAMALAACFSESVHSRVGDVAADQIEVFLTEGPDEGLGEFVHGTRTLIVKAAEAVDRPRCRFAVPHAYGYFGILRCLDDVKLASRLLLLRAVDSASGGDSSPAEQDLMRSLRVIAWLAEVDRIETRVLAATLRAEALEVAAWIFTEGVFRRPTAETLYASMRDNLADWPEDSSMLIGDRAMAIHAYEAIRQGLLDRILTGRERSDLSRRGVLQSLELATPELIDQDQVQYLSSMARLIAVAKQPFYERLPIIEKIAAPTEPRLFAERIFLMDLTDVQRTVARDRGLCEAWTILLSSATGLPMPPYRVCPSNGVEYEVIRNDLAVTVETSDAAIADPICPTF